MTLIVDLLFYATIAALAATVALSLWKSRAAIRADNLVALGWLVLVPIPIVLRPLTPPTGVFPEGFTGAARVNLEIAVGIANLGLCALMAFLQTARFAAFQARFRAWAAGRKPTAESALSLDRAWFVGLCVLSAALALWHLWLMPRVPVWDLVVGFSDAYQPVLDREYADKLLPAPTILRYVFTWNASVIVPALLCFAVLRRWPAAAIAVGVFGLLYVIAPLAKFPSMFFVLAPFVAVTALRQRAIWSPLLVIGLMVSLVPPFLIGQSSGISLDIHRALGIREPAVVATPVEPSATPTQSPRSPSPGASGAPTPEFGPTAAPLPKVSVTAFDPAVIPVYFKDLVLRRTLSVPAEVTYAWFAYFPEAHPFLFGDGWAPWRVLSARYRNPANLVGLWTYEGHVTTLPSVSAYGSVVADGWAEFSYAGVVIAVLGILALALVLELIRSLTDRPFCLACFAPGVLLFATLPPRAGLMATLFSSGLWLVPALCLAYLASERLVARRAAEKQEARA